MIQYDSSCNPIAPLAIAKRDLIPPDEWVTNWNKRSKKPVSIAQSIITESDHQVVTRFPRQLQSSQSAVQTVPIQQSEKMITIQPAMFEQLKAFFNHNTSVTFSLCL